MATQAEKLYTVQAGEKTVRFYITVYFHEGIAVTTFMPEGWTPENIHMPTSLDFAREVAQRYGLDMEQIHEAVINILQEDDDVDIVGDIIEGLRDAKAGRVRSIKDLWQQVHEDDTN